MKTKNIANSIKKSVIVIMLIILTYILYQGFTIDYSETYRGYIDSMINRIYNE